MCANLRNALGRFVFNGDPTRVIVVGTRPRQGYPHLVGDRDILFRIGGFGVDQGSVSAAGQFNTILRRQITLALRSRRSTDEKKGDLDWFLGTAGQPGQLDFESAVIKTVQMYFEDTASEPDGTVRLPIGQAIPWRITSGTDAVKDMYEADGSFGVSTIGVEVEYREPITPPGEPNP